MIDKRLAKSNVFGEIKSNVDLVAPDGRQWAIANVEYQTDCGLSKDAREQFNYAINVVKYRGAIDIFGKLTVSFYLDFNCYIYRIKCHYGLVLLAIVSKKARRHKSAKRFTKFLRSKSIKKNQVSFERSYKKFFFVN